MPLKTYEFEITQDDVDNNYMMLDCELGPTAVGMRRVIGDKVKYIGVGVEDIIIAPLIGERDIVIPAPPEVIKFEEELIRGFVDGSYDPNIMKPYKFNLLLDLEPTNEDASGQN